MDSAYKAADVLLRSDLTAADEELEAKITALETAMRAADSALRAGIQDLQERLNEIKAELDIRDDELESKLNLVIAENEKIELTYRIIIIIIATIEAILVVIIIAMRKKKDHNGTPGTPVAPSDNPDDGYSEPSVSEEPVDEVVPEEPEKPEEEKIDAVKADKLMSNEEALAAVEVSSNSRAAKNGLRAFINVRDINDNFKAGDTVTLDNLKEKKLVSAKAVRLKILADGAIDKAVTVEADSFSAQAIKMIKLTGGKVIRKK